APGELVRVVAARHPVASGPGFEAGDECGRLVLVELGRGLAVRHEHEAVRARPTGHGAVVLGLVADERQQVGTVVLLRHLTADLGPEVSGDVSGRGERVQGGGLPTVPVAGDAAGRVPWRGAGGPGLGAA